MHESERYRWLYRFSTTLYESDRDPAARLQAAVTLLGAAINVPHGCAVAYDLFGKVQYCVALNSDDDTGAYIWLANHTLTLPDAPATLVVSDIRNEEHWPLANEFPNFPQYGSAMVAPLIVDGLQSGVLAFIHSDLNYFDSDLIAFIHQVAGLTAEAISRARASQALSRYRHMYTDAINPMLLTDLDGHIIDANTAACALLGFDEHILLGVSITSVYALDDGVASQPELSSPSDDAVYQVSTRALTALGEDLPVVLRARRLEFDGGAGILWVAQDIREQVELEQLRRDLTAMTYHDLRGPLHNINGALSRMERVLTASPQGKVVNELLHIALLSTQQLSRMVTGLLDIERLEAGTAILDPKPVAALHLAENAGRLLAPVIEDAEQRLMFDLPEDLPLLEVDVDMILRVITNLIENAIKYTPPGGHIVISAREVHDGIVMSISDSGPGMPRQVQESIFDKYVRLSYKDAPRGVGLGLAFCRLAVEAHGGRIWVSSEPGKGAMFSFLLPRVKEEAETEPETA